MKVLPSPVRISAIRPWWRTIAPISWTSYWRMPIVRFMASRPAANTSGIRSSRTAWSRSLSRLRRALARSFRRSRSGWWSSSSDGSSGAASSAISARIDVDPLADLLVGEGLELGLEVVGLVDDRLEPVELAVVGVEESGEQAHGRLSIGWDRASPGGRLRRLARVDRARPGSVLQAARRRRVEDDLRLGGARPASMTPPGSTKMPRSTEMAFGRRASRAAAEARHDPAPVRSPRQPLPGLVRRGGQRGPGSGTASPSGPRRRTRARSPRESTPADDEPRPSSARSVLLGPAGRRGRIQPPPSFVITRGAVRPAWAWPPRRHRLGHHHVVARPHHVHVGGDGRAAGEQRRP